METGKRCSRCKEVKPVGEFWSRKGTKDGLQYYCKDCNNKASAEFLEKHPIYCQVRRDIIAEHHRRWRKQHADKVKRSINKWRRKSPKQLTAYDAVKYAIKTGKIDRSDTCEICGDETKTHAHHSDYTKPLSVDFLCPLCHAMIHRTVRLFSSAILDAYRRAS